MRTTKGISSQVTPAVMRDQLRVATRKVGRYLFLETRIKRLKSKRDSEVQKVVDRYAEQLSPLEDERRELGQTLYRLAMPLIEHFNPGSKFLQLRTGRLSFRKSPDSMEVTDSRAALKRLSDLGLVSKCVKVERKILKENLKREMERLKIRRIRGIHVKAGEDLLYINSIKVETPKPVQPEAQDEASLGEVDEPVEVT